MRCHSHLFRDDFLRIGTDSAHAYLLTYFGDYAILYRMERIIACYDSPYSFSIDLSSAVMRQGSFIKKMVDLKWTEPTFFPGAHSPISPGVGGEGEGGENVHVVVRAIARYHAFLDMMSASGKFYVPTLVSFGFHWWSV